MSAISELDAAYVQQWSRLGDWWRAVESGAPVVERGWALSDDDRLRRWVIRSLMCNFTLSFPKELPWDEQFRDELETLRTLESQGWVALRSDGLSVLERARVRQVASVFDRYLHSSAATYSQAV